MGVLGKRRSSLELRVNNKRAGVQPLGDLQQEQLVGEKEEGGGGLQVSSQWTAGVPLLHVVTAVIP